MPQRLFAITVERSKEQTTRITDDGANRRPLLRPTRKVGVTIFMEEAGLQSSDTVELTLGTFEPSFGDQPTQDAPSATHDGPWGADLLVRSGTLSIEPPKGGVGSTRRPTRAR